MSFFQFFKLVKIYNPFRLMLAYMIARIESNYKPNAVGNSGEVGLFQIKKEYYSDLLENPTIENQVKAFNDFMDYKTKRLLEMKVPINVENLLRAWNGGCGNLHSKQVDAYIEKYRKAFGWFS